MSAAPIVVLNNAVEIPQLGYGVFKVPAEETRQAVHTALDAGYRLIDTAAMCGNEEGVGTAVRESGLLRDEVFVTTKVWYTDQGYDRTMRAFDASMDRLGFDMLDLYLIHWPNAARDLFVETWRAMERLYLDGMGTDRAWGHAPPGPGGGRASRTSTAVRRSRWCCAGSADGERGDPQGGDPGAGEGERRHLRLSLGEEDMSALGRLDRGERTGPHPDRTG